MRKQLFQLMVAGGDTYQLLADNFLAAIEKAEKHFCKGRAIILLELIN